MFRILQPPMEPLSASVGTAAFQLSAEVPGKWNRPSLWPMGEGFGGGVALGGLEDWKGAGEDGVDEVVEEGLLLESR